MDGWIFVVSQPCAWVGGRVWCVSSGVWVGVMSRLIVEVSARLVSQLSVGVKGFGVSALWK